jgi:hypothetical protein
VRAWNDRGLVARTPLATTFLLEYANAGQLVRMWSEQSALGQSLWSWLSVGLALALWWNFYRVMLPGDRFARRCTAFGLVMNAAVCFSVAWFRYLCPGAPR